MGFHEDCLVLDGHTDVPTRLWESPVSLEERHSDRHVDLPRLREGGVDALVFALYIPASLSPERGWKHAQELHRIAVERIEAARGMEIAASAEDVRRAWHRGVVAVLFGLENGCADGAGHARVDALVVAHALEAGGAHVLTGDREDLERLAAPHPEVWIQPL